VVNPEGAPDNYDELVDTGLAHTGAATGLKFKRVGLTDDRDVTTGGFARRRPVLIAWATPEEVPGVGRRRWPASVAVSPSCPPGRMRYVTGRVNARPATSSLRSTPPRLRPAQAIVDHELGHVCGLGHVEDPGELMYAHNLGADGIRPG
jgi:hypothetical protein